MKNIRKLTVRECGDFWLQANGHQRPKASLNLMGYWLIQAGYQPGDQVEIAIVEEGHLVIKKMASSSEREL